MTQIKYVETVSSTFPVDTRISLVSNLLKDDEYVVQIASADGPTVDVFETSRLLPAEFDTGLDAETVQSIAGHLVQARVAAKLAAPHVTYVAYDYREFIWSFFEEMQTHLQLGLLTCGPALCRWIAQVGHRITQAGLTSLDGRYWIQRSNAGQLRISPPRLNSELQQLFWSPALGNSQDYLIYEGTQAECQSVFDQITCVPYQETVTPTQVRRWARLATPPTTQPTLHPTAPGRAIVLPEPMELAI